MAVSQRFICRECRRETLRWEGKCPGCGAWNTLEEASPTRSSGRQRAADGSMPRPLRAAGEEAVPRTTVGFGDVDRVLGGGLVRGSIALLGGAPGIGKSTLLLQVGAHLATSGAKVLYASGEESEEQVRRRAGRLGGGAGDVLFLAATSAERIVEAGRELGPDLLCVDSIQTTVVEGGAAPGSVSQVRDAADQLRVFAKESGVPTIVVGHVTKGGGIAGPRTLEHMVDVVLQFGGGEEARVLRATKNRFGRVGELAVFRMSGDGLAPVTDPGLLASRNRAGGPGSALTATLAGGRPVVVEVQALTSSSAQPLPRRMTTGFPARRLAMLLAVLQRRGGVALDRSEVFVNVVGGFRITDPVADAGVLAALASAELDRALPTTCAFLGEAGLSGELRAGADRDTRLAELVRTGVTDVVVPSRREAEPRPSPAAPGVRVHEVAGVRELVEWVARRTVTAGEGG